MKRLKFPTSEELQESLSELVDWYAKSNVQDIEEYVLKLRAQNPGISNLELAKKVVRRKSLKCGLVGATTGIPGILAFPVTIPADLVMCWRIQIIMIVSVAKIYGHDAKTTDLKTDIILVMAGDSAKEGLKRFGIELGKGITKKTVDKHITRETMKVIWKYVPQKVITKAGEKSFTSFSKMVPLVGAPIGFAFDWPVARIVGNTAIKYYSGGG